MITYNHQDYISEAIQSILNQVTDFSIQLIIGEDNSTDRTRYICNEFANRFPEKIRIITSSVNVGMMKNFLRTYKACEGKYIAFCEGDDYWTDPLKLQKQIDFLEARLEYSACFHNVKIQNEKTKNHRKGDTNEWIMHGSLPKDSFDTKDVLGPWFIASSSFVFVNFPDFELPDWFFNCRYGDLPLMLLLSLRGKFKYIDEVMSVYRLHDKGASVSERNYDKVIIMAYIYTSFNIHTNFQYHEEVRKAIIFEMDTHLLFGEIKNTKEQKHFFLNKYYYKIKKLISTRFVVR